MNKKINVLSLFDGISVAQQALKELGYEPTYYASEIDTYAVKITQHNHPETIQLGDVRHVKRNMPSAPFCRDIKYSLNNIDLLIGGSPCQDLSIAQSKTREGLKGNKSSLFYEYLRILKEIKPRYFILENVASMKDSERDVITEELGVEPIMIDASLVSAQSRKRYFWTNIEVTEPEQNGVVLKDILEQDVDEKYFYKDVPFTIKDTDKNVIGIIEVSGHDILKRIYNTNVKSPTVTTCAGGNTQLKVLDDGRVRKLTPLEYERLQTLPDNYTNIVSNSQRYKGLGNAFNKEVIKHILRHI